MSSRTSRAVKRNNASKHKHQEEHLPQPNTEGVDGEVIAVAQPSKISIMAKKYKLQIMIVAPILFVLFALSTTTYLNYSSKSTTPVAYGQFFAALDSSNSNAEDFNLNRAYQKAVDEVNPATADFITYIMGLIKYENNATTAAGLELLNSITTEPYRSLAQGYIFDATGTASDAFAQASTAKGSTAALLPSIWSYRNLTSNGFDTGNADAIIKQTEFVDTYPDTNLAALVNAIAAGEEK